jgi:predicted phage terminase large subunit-like protein
MSVSQKISATPAERDAICRQDLLTFCHAAFAELYPDDPFSFERSQEAIAQALAGAGERRFRLIINAPPRSLKSFLVSVCWVAFMLGHKPTHRFICASYSQDLANAFSSECRRLMESSFYRGLFATRLIKATEDELVTTAGGFRRAKSVGGTLTGLGGHALIIDDPMNANDAASETIRNSTNEWFMNTLMPRLDDKSAGAIIVVMQRLHQDDLTGHLIEKGGWDRLVLPAIAPRDTLITLGHRKFVWRMGEPLQKREGLESLERTKRDMTPQAFNAQYLQEPLPEKGNMLDPDWLKYYAQAPVRQPGDQVIQSWDTALKPSETCDYSAGVTILVHNNKVDYYLTDVIRKRLNFTDLCNEVEAQGRKHSPNAILVEEHGAGIPLIAEMRKRGLSAVIGRRPTKDKRTRMDGQTPKLQAGCLILPKAAPWLDEFIAEYLAFPGGKFDDQIDALSQFLDYRTEVEARTMFEFDFGYDDQPFGGGAPSAENLLWLLRRGQL